MSTGSYWRVSAGHRDKEKQENLLLLHYLDSVSPEVRCHCVQEPQPLPGKNNCKQVLLNMRPEAVISELEASLPSAPGSDPHVILALLTGEGSLSEGSYWKSIGRGLLFLPCPLSPSKH